VQSLGTRLGCGACLVSLRRMQSGRFHIDDAYGLHEVEKCMKSGRIRELLLLPEDVLSHLEAFEVQGGSEQKALNGNPLAGEDLLPVALQADLALRAGKKIRIQIKGRVMGVGEVRRGPEGFHLQPLRLFRVR